METVHYDVRKVSLKLCCILGLRVVFDPQATDVALTYSPDDHVIAKCLNGHLKVQGSGNTLDISARPVQEIPVVYGSLSERAFNDGEVGAVASGPKTVTTRVYSSGLRVVWTIVPGDVVTEIILSHNLQKKPRLTLTVPPEEDKPVLIKVDGIRL